MIFGRQACRGAQVTELRRRGFSIVRGPAACGNALELARAYDSAFAAAPDAQLKRGSSSTRLGGLVALHPFYHVYLHAPLLGAASELIGGPMTLSSFHARTLLPRVPAQPLHQDVVPGSDGYPLVGFIFMVDEFRVENGATRFVPGSQRLPQPPTDVPRCHGCGPAGSMLIFDGATWHGHGANRSDTVRRSIQGAFIPLGHSPAMRWKDALGIEQASLLPGDARRLLGL